MCNLYRMNKATAEIANLFAVPAPDSPNLASEIYPGYPGLVVARDSACVMTWGFPLALRGRQGQMLKPRPVNNARSDKLASPFWSASFAERRCLIPVTAWAEAQGVKGAMTRTWLASGEGQILAIGGLWRPTVEWGDAYAMVMVDASAQVATIHQRMPLIIAPENWQRWLAADRGDALSLCRPWDGMLSIDRSSAPWAGARASV